MNEKLLIERIRELKVIIAEQKRIIKKLRHRMIEENNDA